MTPNDALIATAQGTIIMAIATVALAIAAFVTAFVASRQGKRALDEARRATQATIDAANATIDQAKLTTGYQLLTQLDQQWASPSMQTKRGKAAETLLRSLAEPKEDAPDYVLDFFETVALTVNEGVIPLHLAWGTFSYWVVHYWSAAADRIKQLRAEDPTLWEDLNKLVPRLLEYDAQRRHSTIQDITPSPKEITRFLKEELGG
ncbi:MAG: hypothetical protein ACHQ9S_00875 [Candidatus Binatia bacterium]